MHPESCVGSNFLSADWAHVFLCAPYSEQFFTPFCTVEKLFTFAFLVVSSPSFVKGICLCDDFMETDNLRIGCIDQLKIGCVGVFIAWIQYCCKRPHGYLYGANSVWQSIYVPCVYVCALPIATGICRFDSLRS